MVIRGRVIVGWNLTEEHIYEPYSREPLSGRFYEVYVAGTGEKSES